MYRRIEHESVTDIAPVSHGNALSLYFRAPEGNRIALFVDTPWYVEQPLRRPRDMDMCDEALWLWTEQTIRELPGFRPVEEWRADFAKRLQVSSPG